MRSRVETTLRVIAFTALVAWIANAARPAIARREVVRGASLAAALPAWTRGERASVDSVRVLLDTVPDAASLAWLTALRGTGVGVSWSGPSIPDIAVESYAAADPGGGIFVLASAPARASRVISDALGPLDTLSTAVSAVRLAATQGQILVMSGKQPARADPAPPFVTRRVFVAGAAGWESKFIVAALEEHGWSVEADLAVGPDGDVRQGARGALDTSRYAAVVLVDSAAAERARGVEQFVRAGGGVVLAGDASRARGIRDVIAWRATPREAAPLGTLPSDTSWRGLSRVPLELVGTRAAIVLERPSGQATVVARRHFAGRVAAIGYDQTWRWRMSGDDSRVAHRDWWSGVVASVALRPAGNDSVATSSAPLVDLYDALGAPATSVRAVPTILSPGAISDVLGLVVFGALLAEWLLRRLRGAA